MDAIQIRAYRPEDRPHVRCIAYETADVGRPIDRLLSDRELFADLVTSYYTDHEPGALWVAEHRGEVVGYLTGCLDSRRYHWAMVGGIVPRAIGNAIARGVFWSAQTWRWLGAGFGTLRYGWPRRIPLQRYPAHLHLNIRDGYRGHQVGTRLFERFLEQARRARLAGMHAAVRGDNEPSRRFFEHLGFAEISRARVVYPGLHVYEPHDTIVYARPVSDAPSPGRLAGRAGDPRRLPRPSGA